MHAAFTIAAQRTPWLVLFLVGLLLCAVVMTRFEAKPRTRGTRADVRAVSAGAIKRGGAPSRARSGPRK